MTRRPRFPALLLALCAAAAAQPAIAQTPSIESKKSAAPEAKESALETITIFGSEEELTRTTGSAHRVDEETLEDFRYDDINRVLQQVPGLYLREEDGFGLRPNIGLRGASSDRSQKVTLMEDGVPFAPAPYSAPAAYFFPLTNRMVGVEVYKGPASIQFGPQTIGGAINLISAPIPEKTEFLFDGAGGSDAYRRLHGRAGTRFGDLGLLGEFVHIASDGFKELDGGGDTGFTKNELLAKAGYPIGPGRLELRAGYANEESDETYLGLTEADFRDNPVRRYRASALDNMDWDWGGVRADWRQPLFGADLHVVGYVHSFERAWQKFNNFNGADVREVLRNPDTPFNSVFVNVLEGENTDGLSGTPDDLRIGTNDREFLAAGVQGKLNWALEQAAFGRELTHLFELGLRAHEDRIRRLHDEFGYEQINGQLVRNSQPRLIVQDNTGHAEAVAGWIRDEIVVGIWTIAPGLRFETIETTFTDRIVNSRTHNQYDVLLPGLGVNAALSQNLTLLAGVHKGFSPATPGRSDDVEPEEAINYEAGARWDGRIGKLEAIGFYSDYSNLTAECTVSTGCAPADLGKQTNAGEVRVYGLETGWTRRFALANGWSVPAQLTYTYTEGEFREAFSSPDPQFGNVQPGFELPYVPPHRANLLLGLAGSSWSTRLSTTYVARMRDQAGKGSFARSEGSDAFTVLDLAAEWEFRRNFSVTGRLDNLLDEEYVVSRRPFGARPGKPQSVQLGLTYRYQ